ncbi:MAG: carbohydrate ABC transporter permease [Oscillospiraceae bacterium]|nr:carbohydrate ABC transporter permease [Oscillospiraceae bacterium]
MAEATIKTPKIKYVKATKKKNAKYRRSNRNMGGSIGVFLILLIFATIMAIPLVFMIISAFKPQHEFFLFPPRFFVRDPTLENFRIMGDALSNLQVPFERYFFNSAWISVVVTSVYLFIATMAAYPLAKHNFPGKKGMNSIIQLALMFTGPITAVPLFMVQAGLGLIDHPLSLGIILPALASTMGVFLCVQYLDSIPNAVIESAKIDGAGNFRTYWQVVMPNCRPIIMTILIFQFQGIWAVGATNVVFTESLKTLPAAMGQIATAGIARAGVGLAAGLLLIIPPVLVFTISQAKVIETMAHSGIKD